MMSRRKALATIGASLVAAPGAVRAQGFSGPIRVGGLVPLTGIGAPYGPVMVQIHKAVIDEVNKAGGIAGQQIEYFSEDDQVNPDAGVLAARKLIDINKVGAILGAWSSSVAAPVLPICWENKVMLIGIASADSLVELPHQGYFVRTHPHTAMQGRQMADFAIKRGARHFHLMLPQQPYTEPTIKAITAACGPAGIKVSSVIYDIRKTSFRSEVDQMVKSGADAVFLGGYPPDLTILTRDLYRAEVKVPIVGFASGINQALIDGAGKQVVEGIYTPLPVPATGSSAYERVQKITGKQQPDQYACQAYDHVSLFILAAAKAKAASGTAIRDNIRAISNGPGERVTDALTGLRLLSEGKAIDYDGASGPCAFEQNGNVATFNFQLQQIKDGTFVNAAA